MKIGHFKKKKRTSIDTNTHTNIAKEEKRIYIE